jgi:hypothetical protein
MLFLPTKGQFDRIVAEGLSDVESPLSLSKIAINIRDRVCSRMAAETPINLNVDIRSRS